MSLLFFTVAANAEMRFLFLREKMIRKKEKYTRRWKKANIAGLIMALLSSLGLLLVACFQVNSCKATDIMTHE